MKPKMKSKYYCFLMGLFLIFPMYGQEILEVQGNVTSAYHEVSLTVKTGQYSIECNNSFSNFGY